MRQFSIIFLILVSCAEKNISVKIITEPKESLPSFSINKSQLLGQLNYKNDSLFVLVNKNLANKEIYLNRVAYDSFVEMHIQAKKDSIDLRILSGLRNFDDQKNIWIRKWNSLSNLDSISKALKILEYSSMPGTSRHHWGTEVDLNSLNNSYFESGKGEKEYNWLCSNACKYGFYQPYTNRKNRTGYNEEKWHWSFLPLSKLYLNEYNKSVKIEDIKGFKGALTSFELKIISDYVNGIDAELLIN